MGMSVEQIVGLVLALLIMGVGLAGSILPAIPSTPLVLIAAIAHKIYFGHTGAGWIVLTILILITLVSLVMDYLSTVYGAKQLGATRWGSWGAIIGVIVGMFFSLPGLLIGPFLGALAFEMVGGRNFKASSKAGVGATLGLLAGSLGRIACCLAMMGLFTVNVVYRSLSS